MNTILYAVSIFKRLNLEPKAKSECRCTCNKTRTNSLHHIFLYTD